MQNFRSQIADSRQERHVPLRTAAVPDKFQFWIGFSQAVVRRERSADLHQRFCACKMEAFYKRSVHPAAFGQSYDGCEEHRQCREDIARDYQAIDEEKTTPIDETGGEVINMRMETIAAMIKVGVDPSDHFVEPKCDAEMVGTVDTATMRVTTTRFRCESPIPRLCTLGTAITRAGEKYQRH